MNFVSYITYFSDLFYIFIWNIIQQARNDRNSVYIVIKKIKIKISQKTHRLLYVAVCKNFHYTHKYRVGYF